MMRSINKQGLALTVALAAGHSMIAAADETWQRGLDVDGSLMYSHMEERIDGHAVVTEKGPLPGFGGRFFLRSGQAEFGVALDLYGGQINYYGQSQDQQTLATQPYNTKSNTVFTTLTVDENVWLGPVRLGLFEAGNGWQRDVLSHDGVASGQEQYSWLSLGASVATRFSLGNTSVTPELDLWHNQDVEQIARSGSYDRVTLQPVGRFGRRASVALGWKLDDHREVRLRPWVQAYNFGASDYVLATQGGQPVVVGGQQIYTYQPGIHYVQGGIDLVMDLTL